MRSDHAGVEVEVAVFRPLGVEPGGGVEEAEGKLDDEAAVFVEGSEVVEAAARESGSMRARKGSVLSNSRKISESRQHIKKRSK
jgi:hypothetical protein